MSPGHGWLEGTHAPHCRVWIRLILGNIMGHIVNQPTVPAAAVHHQIKRPVALAGTRLHAAAAITVLRRGRHLERRVHADTRGDGAVEEHWQRWARVRGSGGACGGAPLNRLARWTPTPCLAQSVTFFYSEMKRMHARALAQYVVIQVEHAATIDSSAIQVPDSGSQCQHVCVRADVGKDGQA
jgi:hypothetical protein